MRKEQPIETAGSEKIVSRSCSRGQQQTHRRQGLHTNNIIDREVTIKTNFARWQLLTGAGSKLALSFETHLLAAQNGALSQGTLPTA